MPTKFEEIYGRAIFKFTDYSFLDSCRDIKEAVLQKYLLSSIVDFKYDCVLNLEDYNLEKEEFNIELDNEIIEILSLGIAYYWLNAQVFNKQLLKNQIHNRDYISYSPANLLSQIRALRNDLEKEYRGKINSYSFKHGSIEKLKV